MTEERGRFEVAALCTRLYERRLVAGTSGNVSLRIRGDRLLCTPSGVSLGHVAPGDLVLCDPEGRTELRAVSGTSSSAAGSTASGTAARRPTSELPLHLAAYRARPDITCVVHTHPTYCVAWSKTGALFPLDTVGAIESLGTIAFTRYAKSGSVELADVCAAALAHVDTIVMERHGLTSVARDLQVAFDRTDLAEATAQLEFAAQMLRAANARCMPEDRPPIPLAEFHGAAGDAQARASVDAFHAEYSAQRPDPRRLEAHAQQLRGSPSLLATFERWWLEPRVQAFIAELNATGL